MREKVRKAITVLIMTVVIAVGFAGTGNIRIEAKTKTGTEKRTKSDYNKKRKATKEEKKLFENPGKIENVKGFADEMALVFVDAKKYEAGGLRYAGYSLKEKWYIGSKEPGKFKGFDYHAYDSEYIPVLNIMPGNYIEDCEFSGLAVSKEKTIKAVVIYNIEGAGKNGYSESTPEAKNIKYTSSDKSVFTVAEDGTITPKNPGIAELTAEAGKKIFTVRICVSSITELIVPVTDSQVYGKMDVGIGKYEGFPHLRIDYNLEYKYPLLRKITFIDLRESDHDEWLQIHLFLESRKHEYAIPSRKDGKANAPGYEGFSKADMKKDGLEYRREKDKAITISYNGNEHIMEYGISYATLYREGIIEYPCYIRESYYDLCVYKALQQMLDRCGLSRNVLLSLTVSDLWEVLPEFIGKYFCYDYALGHKGILTAIYSGGGVCDGLSPIAAHLWKLTGRDAVLIVITDENHEAVSIYEEDTDKYNFRGDYLWGYAKKSLTSQGSRFNEWNTDEVEFIEALITTYFIADDDYYDSL